MISIDRLNKNLDIRVCPINRVILLIIVLILSLIFVIQIIQMSQIKNTHTRKENTEKVPDKDKMKATETISNTIISKN